jgi:fatty acid elongase 3
MFSIFQIMPSSYFSAMEPPQWLQYGKPTFEHPFGIRIWPVFDAVFELIVGYKPQDFMFIFDYTPLSTFQETVTVLLCYYSIVFCGPFLMQNKKPFKLKFLFKAYNLLLVGLSGGLMLLFIEQVTPTIAKHGTLYAICEYNGGYTDELVLLYYVSLI